MNRKMIILPLAALLITAGVAAAANKADAETYPVEAAESENADIAEEAAEEATESEAEAPDEYAGWTEMQIWAHETADSARAVGLAEDNPIIAECQRLWHEEEDGKALPQGIPYDEVEPEYAEPTMTYLGNYYITGYSPWCGHCCGKAVPDAITASGVVAEVGRTIAMCKDFAFGTKIYIDGLGYYVVEDRGVGKGCIDVACNNHSECYAITGHYDVYIVEEG